MDITSASYAKPMSDSKYACWFCGLGLDRADGSALSIGLWGLWDGAEDEPKQTIYAHWHCAETRMKGASMNLERDVFLPDEEER